MCDTPPSSLSVSDSADIGISDKEDDKLLEVNAAFTVETNSNESNSLEVASTNSCQSTTGDRTTRNSIRPTPASSRFTRSRDNPEFVAKHKNFIAQVQAANLGIDGPLMRQETAVKRKNVNSPQPTAKKKKLSKADTIHNSELQHDSCCWECHREGQFICCEMCPRVFHLKCVSMEKEPDDDWACHECHSIMLVENVDNRSRAMQLISVDQLCTLLKFALSRLKASPALSPFCNPVDTNEFPTYRDVIIHPLDLLTLEKNIKKKLYGSTEAFLADAKWIYHNSVIFNGANSKVTSLAKTLMKILKQELSEIETCPDCYQNAHLKPDSWFTEACRLAHPLVWAKLKGFPYWPAKAVKWKEGNVDVRFFGRHDRSWVQLKDCCLYSEQSPTAVKGRNKTLENCHVEVVKHIENLKERFGEFRYAPPRVIYNPHDTEQIKLLLPHYKGPMILKVKPSLRTPSRQSQSGTDDDASSVTSSDSYSIYSRKVGLIEPCSLLFSEAQSNQDDSEVKMDEGGEDEGDKCDIDCDLEFKITNVQTVKMDSILQKEEEASKSDSEANEILDNADDAVGVVNVKECVDNKKCDTAEEEANQINADKCDSESNLNNVDVGTPASDVTTHINECDNKISANDALKPDTEPNTQSSPISIKQAVEGDSMLLDDELELRDNLKQVSESEDNSKQEKNTVKVSLNTNADDSSQLNESVLNLECINALLASPKCDKSVITEEPSTNVEPGSKVNGPDFEDSSKNSCNITKCDSARSSIDENSFPGFFSEDSANEKADSCKSALKNFRLQNFLRKNVDSEDEIQSAVAKASSDDDAKAAVAVIAKISSSESDLTEQNEDLPKDGSPSVKIAATAPEQPVERISSDDGSDSVVEEEEEDPLRISETPPPIDIKNYASKMFHNVTVGSSSASSIKDLLKPAKRPSRNVSSDSDIISVNKSLPTPTNMSDTLMAAVEAVQNIGNIAIKKVDSKTLEHTSGSDKVTISVSESPPIPRRERAAPKSVKEARKGYHSSQVKHQLAAMGSSVSLGKATENRKEDKAKMPSGVDTTRLSPSISITAVTTAGSTEKRRVRCTSTASIPSGIPATTSTPTSAKSGSPSVSSGGRATPSSNVSVSPSIPPPLLSHPMASSPGTIRGILGAHLPHLQGFQGNPRGPMPSPAIRMIGPSPAMLLANRLSAGVLRPSPPDAGPLSAELGKHSLKLAEMMRSSLEEVIGGLVGMGSPEARLAALQLELERCNWRHQQELADVRHNADVMLVEMRASMEADKQRAVDEARKQVEQKVTDVRRTIEQQTNDRICDIRKQCDGEKKREVEETKKKQWCANCYKEAPLFCCWNTSYCDYPCQQNHWPQHMSVCGHSSEQGPGTSTGGDADMETTNGNMSGQSSGLSTPVHGNLGSQMIEEDEGLMTSEERRRKKRKENPSLFADPITVDAAPGSIISTSYANNFSVNKPMSVIGPGLLRPQITSSGMPMGIIGGSSQMGMPRFLQHSMIQPQQNMFGAVDPRMVMMIGRGMGNPAMLRGHLQPFRPRFM